MMWREHGRVIGGWRSVVAPASPCTLARQTATFSDGLPGALAVAPWRCERCRTQLTAGSRSPRLNPPILQRRAVCLRCSRWPRRWVRFASSHRSCRYPDALFGRSRRGTAAVPLQRPALHNVAGKCGDAPAVPVFDQRRAPPPCAIHCHAVPARALERCHVRQIKQPSGASAYMGSAVDTPCRRRPHRSPRCARRWPWPLRPNQSDFGAVATRRTVSAIDREMSP